MWNSLIWDWGKVKKFVTQLWGKKTHQICWLAIIKYHKIKSVSQTRGEKNLQNFSVKNRTKRCRFRQSVKTWNHKIHQSVTEAIAKCNNHLRGEITKFVPQSQEKILNFVIQSREKYCEIRHSIARKISWSSSVGRMKKKNPQNSSVSHG